MQALTTGLEIGGIAAIVVGVALFLSLPLALIAAGIGAIALSWRLSQ